jgi:hypothetical protein
MKSASAGARPTSGYWKIAALLKRERRSDGLPRRPAATPRKPARWAIGRSDFQAQLELFLGQGLGPASKAIPLQLLDDLAQPFALRPLSQQHRLEPVGIGDGCHEAD